MNYSEVKDIITGGRVTITLYLMQVIQHGKCETHLMGNVKHLSWEI